MTWSADLDCVKSRCTFHFRVLEEVPRGVGHEAAFQHRLPPTDGRTEGADDSNARGHASGICVGLRRELGYVFSVGWVFL